MGNKSPESSYFVQIKKNWIKYLSNRSSLVDLSITLFLIITILIIFAHFINTIEARNGAELKDPLLKLFKPIDLSGLIFSIIYLSIIIGLISLLNDPGRFVFALQVYVIMVIIRILTLYLTPLNPPENMIPLVDPIVKNLGTGRLLTKDLFFSGHTATMFLLFLVSNNRKLKIVFFVGFIIIALSVLIQHAHYSIDVIAAPFFTYVSYKIVLLIKEKYQF